MKNYLSFGDGTEFNMLPNARYSRLNEHKYNIQNTNILKLTSIYGANAAGKSNLIKAIKLLKNIATGESLPIELNKSKFRFAEKDENILLVIEFFKNNNSYMYGLEIQSNRVVTEELYSTGLGKKSDKLIFERNTDKNDKTVLKFSEKFESNPENLVLQKVLVDNFIKSNKSIIKFLANLKNDELKDLTEAYDWLENDLEIINPNDKPISITQQIDTNKAFKKYAENIMCSFNLGITGLETIKVTMEEFFGQNYEKEFQDIINKLEKFTSKTLSLQSKKGEELIITKENNEFYVKKLKVKHQGQNQKIHDFDIEEESDGTIRLLDFAPAFRSLIHNSKVFIIDEIERSIHPLMVKELVRKFSLDSNSKGQLIFTTHESNLLDQKIFRQDEIWFVEKDKNSKSKIYSLSDFKEHNTTNIQNGYLAGRYGSIPFLSNLKDLSW